MLRLVFGMGTRAVDREADDYARLIRLDKPLAPPMVEPKDAFRFSQHQVDVIDMHSNRFDTVPVERIQKTKLGTAMRAASFDTETAQLMGVDSDKVISMTFCIGSALAAAAGVLVGVYYNTIDPLMGIMPGLKAFVAAVLGGIGILPGAVVGGIVLGVVEALVAGFISSTFRDAAAFAILILVLLIKPSGLFGKNTNEKV